MKTPVKLGLVVLALLLSESSFSQCGAYETDGDENYNCGMGTCCQVWNACNGPNSPCYNYDPDYYETGGCDLSCTPIDSGILFLLIGGAAFGGMMIMRRRHEAFEVVQH